MVQSLLMSADVTERVVRRLGREHIAETIDPARTALLVVDMQNYFMKAGQPACCDAAREIVPVVNRLATELRDAGALIAWIQTEALPETEGDWSSLYAIYRPEAQAARYQHLAQGSDGHALWPALEVEPADMQVTKLRYSAFLPGPSEIEERLRAKGIDTVLVAGVATNVCCDSTARDAMMRGFYTVMVSDALAAISEAEHVASLTTFYLYFGDVLTSDEIIGRLAPAQVQAAQ